MKPKFQKPFINLKVGDVVTSKHLISPSKVKYFKYSSECPSNFSTIPIGSEMQISAKSNDIMEKWATVYVPHTHNTMTLKMSAEELVNNFTWSK